MANPNPDVFAAYVLEDIYRALSICTGMTMSKLENYNIISHIVVNLCIEILQAIDTR
jgi:hypothetical protein